jgi:membrane protein
LKSRLKNFWEVLKKAGIRWDEINPWRQSAIISFYSIFSLPALLLIIIVMTGYFFGEEAVSNQLSDQIEGWVGEEAANIIETMVANAADPGSSTIAFIAGIGFLIFGATTVFYQLQISLNLVWGVVPKPKRAMIKYLRDRLFSFGLILAIGFLMLITFLINSIVSAMSDWIQAQLPEEIFILITITRFLIPLLVITIMFALMYKILPDAIIRWKSVWVGAFLTAILFTLGQWGLSVYFRLADPGSAYGAAGSVIIILLWISYVAMILLYGAVFTREWAIKFGHGIRPKESAELVNTSSGDYYSPSE